MQTYRAGLRQKHADLQSRTQTEARRLTEQDSDRSMQTYRAGLGQKHADLQSKTQTEACRLKSRAHEL